MCVQGVSVAQNTNYLTKELTQLREKVIRYFDEEELRTLCGDLGVDYDDLRGEGKAAKAREFVNYLERRGRLPELVRKCSELRPKVAWLWHEPPATLISQARQMPRTLRRNLAAAGLVWVLLISVVLALFIATRQAQEPANNLGRQTPSLSSTAQDAQDRIDKVERLTPLLLWDFKSPGQHRMVLGLDLFVLDSGAGQLYQLALDEIGDRLTIWGEPAVRVGRASGLSRIILPVGIARKASIFKGLPARPLVK